MTQDLNDVCEQVAIDIIVAIRKSLDQTWDQFGEEMALAVNDTVISQLVGSMVYQELMLKPERRLRPKERQAFTEDNYQAVKRRVQECVSGGFETATKAFSGIDTQYYCQVKRIPPVDKNKLC